MQTAAEPLYVQRAMRMLSFVMAHPSQFSESNISLDCLEIFMRSQLNDSKPSPTIRCLAQPLKIASSDSISSSTSSHHQGEPHRLQKVSTVLGFHRHPKIPAVFLHILHSCSLLILPTLSLPTPSAPENLFYYFYFPQDPFISPIAFLYVNSLGLQIVI